MPSEVCGPAVRAEGCGGCGWERAGSGAGTGGTAGPAEGWGVCAGCGVREWEWGCGWERGAVSERAMGS